MSTLRKSLSKIAREEIHKFDHFFAKQYSEPVKTNIPSNIDGYTMKWYGTSNTDVCVTNINAKLAALGIGKYQAIGIPSSRARHNLPSIQIVKC